MLASENYKISVLERESHALDREINGHIRERPAREGHFHEPSMQSKRLVCGGHRNAEEALAENYAAGDVVAFRHAYKRFGLETGR